MAQRDAVDELRELELIELPLEFDEELLVQLNEVVAATVRRVRQKLREARRELVP